MRRAPIILSSFGFFLLAGCLHVSNSGGLPLHEQALGHIEREEYAQALPILESLHRQAPDDLHLARSLTECYVKLGRTEVLLDRLDRTQPTASHLYMQGLVYYSRASDAAEPAVASFRRAIEVAPHEPELHFRLGVALLESEQDEEALPPLRRAFELAPQHPRYALPLAKAQFRTGDRAAAVHSLRKAIEGKPNRGEVTIARALMDQIGDPFERVPQSARGRLETALRWLHDHDLPQQAIVTLEELAQELPDLAILHSLLGLAYQRIEDVGRAVEEFKRAIELEPLDGQAHFYLGQLYLSRQRPQQAATHLQRALELNPLLDEAYGVLGDLALERLELDQALRLFQTLSYLQPGAPGPSGKLSQVLQRQGNFQKADEELRIALKQNPGNLELKLRLGLLHAEHYARATAPHERRAAKEQAARWLQQVLEAQPDNALASRALAQVHER